jgi:ABC-type multidrug transport system fused ATPase/permease subunit
MIGVLGSISDKMSRLICDQTYFKFRSSFYPLYNPRIKYRDPLIETKMEKQETLSDFAREVLTVFPIQTAAHVALIIVMTAIDAMSLLSIAPIVDFLLNPDLEDMSSLTQKLVTWIESVGVPVTLINLCLVFVALNTVKALLATTVTHSMLKIKYAMQREIVCGTFARFFRARWFFFSSGESGKLLNTFIRESSVFGDAIATVSRLFASVMQVFLYLFLPFSISWQVTSMSLVAGVFLAVPFLLFGKVNRRLGTLNTETSNKMASIIQESLISAKVILGFGNQQSRVASLYEAFDAHRNVTIKSQTLSYAIPNMYYPLGLVVVIISLFTAQKLAVPFSEIVVLLYALMRAVPVFGVIVGQKNQIENYFPSYAQVKSLQTRADKFRQKTGSGYFGNLEEEIDIASVDFAYPGVSNRVLTDVNIHIKRGTIVAIVGESGAGKSTLIDLIMGLSEPLSGEIRVDGVDLQEIDIVSYRKRLGYVPQDSMLFNMTIRENMLWSKEDATDEEIHFACQRANATEFIGQLPDGFDTVIGDRGVRLSGGQIQRIALARAILRKPALLVLDEATSSLDSNSERLIQQSLETIAQETTILCIAHRFSTIVRADNIYVLNEGRVIEEGTYTELLRLNGHFCKMAQMQLLEQ